MIEIFYLQMTHNLSRVVILPNIYDNYYIIFFQQILYVNYKIKLTFIFKKYRNSTY